MQALVDCNAANPEDLPGNFYGGLRQVLGDPAVGARVSFVLEVESLGEFEEMILARAALNRSDEQRGALF